MRRRWPAHGDARGAAGLTAQLVSPLFEPADDGRYRSRLRIETTRRSACAWSADSPGSTRGTSTCGAARTGSGADVRRAVLDLRTVYWFVPDAALTDHIVQGRSTQRANVLVSGRRRCRRQTPISSGRCWSCPTRHRSRGASSTTSARFRRAAPVRQRDAQERATRLDLYAGRLRAVGDVRGPGRLRRPRVRAPGRGADADVLDNLIAAKRIPAVVAILPDSLDGETRTRELTCNPDFNRFRGRAAALARERAISPSG